MWTSEIELCAWAAGTPKQMTRRRNRRAKSNIGLCEHITITSARYEDGAESENRDAFSIPMRRMNSQLIWRRLEPGGSVPLSRFRRCYPQVDAHGHFEEKTKKSQSISFHSSRG